jgi:hypothetical protein
MFRYKNDGKSGSGLAWLLNVRNCAAVLLLLLSLLSPTQARKISIDGRDQPICGGILQPDPNGFSGWVITWGADVVGTSANPNGWGVTEVYSSSDGAGYGSVCLEITVNQAAQEGNYGVSYWVAGTVISGALVCSSTFGIHDVTRPYLSWRSLATPSAQGQSAAAPQVTYYWHSTPPPASDCSLASCFINYDSNEGQLREDKSADFWSSDQTWSHGFPMPNPDSYYGTMDGYGGSDPNAQGCDQRSTNPVTLVLLLPQPCLTGPAQSGTNTGGNTGYNTGGNTGYNTGGNTGYNTGANTGYSSGSNTGANTGVNTGANTGANTGVNTGANTGSNTGENTGANTGSNTGVNTGANSGANTGVTGNTGANNGYNNGTNTGNNGANTGANTGYNTGQNTGANTGTNTGSGPPPEDCKSNPDGPTLRPEHLNLCPGGSFGFVAIGSCSGAWSSSDGAMGITGVYVAPTTGLFPRTVSVNYTDAQTGKPGRAVVYLSKEFCSTVEAVGLPTSGSDQGCGAGSGFPSLVFTGAWYSWPGQFLKYLADIALWFFVPQQCVMDNFQTSYNNVLTTGLFATVGEMKQVYQDAQQCDPGQDYILRFKSPADFAGGDVCGHIPPTLAAPNSQTRSPFAGTAIPAGVFGRVFPDHLDLTNLSVAARAIRLCMIITLWTVFITGIVKRIWRVMELWWK